MVANGACSNTDKTVKCSCCLVYCMYVLLQEKLFRKVLRIVLPSIRHSTIIGLFTLPSGSYHIDQCSALSDGHTYSTLLLYRSSPYYTKHCRLGIHQCTDTVVSNPVHHPMYVSYCSKKNQNAPRPSEHPPGGKNVKTFRWDQRLQIQNLFMAFKWVPRWK